MTHKFSSFADLAVLKTQWVDSRAITLALLPVGRVSDDMTPQDAVYDFMNRKRYHSEQQGFDSYVFTIESVGKLIDAGVVALKFEVPNGQSTTVVLSELSPDAGIPAKRTSSLHDTLGMYGTAIQATEDCITHTGRYRGRNKLWNPPEEA